MYKIVKARRLADKIFLMDVHAPRVASHCQPGQFIIVKMDEKGERIPLTICDYDREAGTITIVFQIVGASTEKMSHLKAGDAFSDFVGPLGCPSELIHENIEDLKKQEKEDIKAMEDELCLLTYAVLACLKGLKEQGCNGPVTEAIGKIEKHINQKAHGQET